MSTFRQNCPGCGRMLELPIDGKGRLGQCPACDATFTIGESPDADANPPSGSVAEIPAKLESRGKSADSPTEDGRVAAEEGFASTRALQITECAIEDVLSTTLSIYAARWRSCIVPSAILGVATLFLIVLPMVILDEINKAGATTAAAVGYMLFLPFAFVFAVFASVGMARVAVAVARDAAAPLKHFMPPSNVTLRAMGGLLILSLASGFVLIVMFSFVAIFRVAGAKELAGLLQFLAVLASFGFAFGLVGQLWGWLPICADDKGTAIGSMRAAQAIASQNKLTSFFIALVALILFLLGTLLCLVGHLVTASLTMLLFAVGYLMMTGQAISDPRDVSTGAQQRTALT